MSVACLRKVCTVCAQWQRALLVAYAPLLQPSFQVCGVALLRVGLAPTNWSECEEVDWQCADFVPHSTLCTWS